MSRKKGTEKGTEGCLWVSATTAILSFVVRDYHHGFSAGFLYVACVSFALAIGFKVGIFPFPRDRRDI